MSFPIKPLAWTLPLLLGLSLPAHASRSGILPTPPHSITSPARTNARPIPVDALYSTRRTGGPAWSPDGTWVVFTTDITGRPNLWKVPAGGGWPIQLSVSQDREYFPAWSPDGKWIVYQSDHGGNETWDLYAVPAAGGASINLTHSPGISESNPLWSPDGTHMLMAYKGKDASARGLAVMDWKTRKIRMLTHETTAGHVWNAAAWSPDGRYVYATRINIAYTNANVYRIDVATGAMCKLTRHHGDVMEVASAISPDGTTLLLNSNARNGDDNVALLDIASGKLHWITHTAWSAQSGEFSPDGKYFYYYVDADGQVATYLVERASLHATRLDFPEGLVYPTGFPNAFSPDGRRLLMDFQNAQRPADLWTYDVATGHARQLTHSTIASLRPADIPPARLVHYRSFDGTMISAYLWMPYNLERDGSHPAVVLAHGGPGGQTVDDFNPLAAALASRGYICIAPNVRGSTGYGAKFQNANYQDLGGGDLEDEVYATRFLVDTGYVDRHRIGITGGSYGGYMALMAIGKTPDVWAAAVERYGIIDWLTMLKSQDPLLRAYETSLLGDPVKNHQAYVDDSPVTYIRHAKAPLLVLQGDNDIRVPREEAEQVVRIMRKNRHTVAAHFYPHEGHGFVRREDRIDATKRTLAWFDTYLKGRKATSE